jgi:hypothetical protein
MAQLARIKRAVAQKHLLKVLERERGADLLQFKVLGSTGSIYEVCIRKGANVTCTCMDFQKNHARCKHLHLLDVKFFKRMPSLMGVTFTTVEEFQALETCWAAQAHVQDQAQAQAQVQDQAQAPACRNSSEECPICFEALHAEVLHAEVLHAEVLHAEVLHAEVLHAEVLHAEANPFVCSRCQNGFHRSCIAEVRQYQSKCPLCRAPLADEEEEEEKKDVTVANLMRQIANL